MTLDTSGLLPGDVVAAVHSFPGRFAATVDPDRFGDPPEHQVAARDAALAESGTDGRSLLGTLAGVDALAQLADRCVAELTLHGGGAVDWPPQPVGGDPAHKLPDIDALLVGIERSIGQLAERLESLSVAGWGAGGTTTTGSAITVLDLLRDLVRRVADDLRAIDDVMGRNAAAD